MVDERVQGPLGLLGRDPGQETSLAGEVERVEAEQLADRAHLGTNRDADSSSTMRSPERAGHLVADRRRRRRASGRAGVHLGTGSRAAPRPARPSGAQSERSPALTRPWRQRHDRSRRDRRADPTTRTTSPGRTRWSPRSRPGRHHPEPGGDGEGAVALAARHHLGVAGDDRHAGLARGARGARDEGVEQLRLEPLLEDQGPGQPQRPRAGHGQVVDRAAHRQIAEVAAREDRRVDHEAVGGQRRPARRQLVAAPPSPRGSRARGCRGGQEGRAGPAGASAGRRRRGRAGSGPGVRLTACATSSQPLVAVPGGAGALARDHAGADRRVGRARRCEQRAVRRVDAPAQHLAAAAAGRLARLGTSTSMRAASRCDHCDRSARPGAGNRRRGRARPWSAGVEEAVHQRPRGEVALGGDHARVEVDDARSRRRRRCWRPAPARRAARRSARSRPPLPETRAPRAGSGTRRQPVITDTWPGQQEAVDAGARGRPTSARSGGGDHLVAGQHQEVGDAVGLGLVQRRRRWSAPWSRSRRRGRRPCGPASSRAICEASRGE